MSRSSNRKRGWPARWTRFSRSPVDRLSTPRTVWPSRNRRSLRCEPRNPAAPVTRTCMLKLSCSKKSSQRSVISVSVSVSVSVWPVIVAVTLTLTPTLHLRLARLAFLRMVRGRSAHAHIGESVVLHLQRLVQVSAVDHDREAHGPVQTRQIHGGKLLPVGQNQHRVGILRGAV